MFVLPAVAAMDPAAAAAMVRYRLRRLAAARARARAAGMRGARFPRESAAGGEDVTPSTGQAGGHRIPILTGQLEEHITADVAWAAARIDGVIGPDEYYERVDDNAFTNVMARWNLRAAADVAGRAGVAPEEADR